MFKFVFNALLPLPLLSSYVSANLNKLVSSSAIVTLNVLLLLTFPEPTSKALSSTFKFVLNDPNNDTCAGVMFVGFDTLSTPLTTVLCFFKPFVSTFSLEIQFDLNSLTE